MYEALISACQAVDAFGLPRAVGRFDADRFIFANNSFLQAAGVERDEIASLALSGVVKIHLSSPQGGKSWPASAMAVRRERERQQIADYVHEYIAPELLSAVFLIESIRLELQDKEPAAAAELKELGNRLTKLIEPVFLGA